MTHEYEATDLPCHKEVKWRMVSDGGYDSDVYRVGAYVIKAYKRGPLVRGTTQVDLTKLQLYLDVTNKASELAETGVFTGYFPFSHTDLAVRVNPLLGIRQCLKCGFVEGVAPYIDGNNLERLQHEIGRQDIKHALTRLELQFKNLLGVVGIVLDPVNVKKRGETLVVTDLCANISHLKKR